jgi:DNA-binding transcriptional ArsR family regulator
VTLRMVFDRDDLQRVRLARDADPMWELVLSLLKTRNHRVPPALVPWRQEVDRRLSGSAHESRVMPLLHGLVTPEGDFPDFLTPPELVTDIDEGCEAVACTPRIRLASDLGAVFPGRSAPPWIRLLANGDREQVGEAVRALRTGHDVLVAPRWATIRETVVADHRKRTKQAMRDGIGSLLGSLPGVLSWDGRVLRTRYPEERTVHLKGRGLILLPSYFCWGNPVTWIDPELPPVLVYEAFGHRGRSLDVAVPDRLVSLVGRTRAECLRLLLSPRTTTELAEQLGASIGTASKQAAVLRDTGLITSNRCGAAVRHNITSLGVSLLVGEPIDT